MKLGRVLVVLAVALIAGLVTDWLRSERVVFPRPLPVITTESNP